MTTERHAGPIRFKDAAGTWQPVNLDLTAPAADGHVAAASHPQEVAFGGVDAQGEAAVASGGRSGQRITLGWGQKLGRPVVSGTTARWVDALPGTDVVAQSRRSGFEALLQVKSASAVAAAKTAQGVTSWELPLKTSGLTAKVAVDGGVDFADAKGVVVSRLAPMFAWDSAKDASGGPASLVKVTPTVTQKGKGRATLTLTPDQKWITAPDRAFPITIDPTYASGSVAPTYDAFVQTGFSTDQSASSELRVGTYDGGTNVARSYLTFPNSVKGLQIQSASLSLYETYAYSCTARSVGVYTSGLASTATRWTAQPTVASTPVGSATVAKGYSSSCAAGRVNIPVTAAVQSWTSSSATSVSLALKAASETDSFGWKKFGSSESSTDPVLTYTYNRKPNAASSPAAQKSAQYGGAMYVSYPDSAFTAAASDPDGNGVRITFEVHSTSTNASSATKVASCESPIVASGKSASCVPSPALPDGRDLFVRAAVRDDQGLWNGTWSPWVPFKTAFAKPATPTVACDGFADGDWASAAPAAAVPCRVTVPSAANANNQPVRVNVFVDGASTPTAVIDTAQKAGTFGGISVPNTPGGHSVRAVSATASTWTSDPAQVAFGWGDPDVTAPTAGSATNGQLAVKAAGPPSNGVAVSARVRYRVAGDPDAAWTDGTSLQTSGTGSAMVAATGTWDTAQAVSGDAARTPTLLEMSVCFT